MRKQISVLIVIMACLLNLSGCSKQTSGEFKRDVNEVARKVDKAFEK